MSPLRRRPALIALKHILGPFRDSTGIYPNPALPDLGCGRVS